MFGFQELFDRQLEELFRPNKLGVRILENDLEGIGIMLTESQRSDLENQFLDLNDTNALNFDFDDSQLAKAGYTSEEELGPLMQEVVDKLLPKIENFTNNIDKTMHSLIEGIADDMSESIFYTLDKQIHDMAEDQDMLWSGFANDIQLVWGEALVLLQGLIAIADESMLGYIEQLNDSVEDEDLTQDLLVRIHAKSIQVAKEILTLLKNGFPDGAQARWRTLHELSVVSSFLAEHEQDTAERYINHEIVHNYKAAIQYNDYYTQLGAEPISDKEIVSMEKNYHELVNQYGKSYKYDYGWAANALGKEKPTFRDIEASVNLDHLRPYYKAASANIHSNPTGVFKSLALLPEEDIILSGPSGIGLADPALPTVVSLNIATVTMLTYDTKMDHLVISKVIARYAKKVEDAFTAVESKLFQSSGI